MQIREAARSILERSDRDTTAKEHMEAIKCQEQGVEIRMPEWSMEKAPEKSNVYTDGALKNQKSRE